MHSTRGEKMGIKIVETSLRDGHQSLIATRMTTDEILSVIDDMDNIGYYALKSGAEPLSIPACVF